MPKSFRTTFKEQGCAVCYRKRTSGRYVCSYEIRYRRNGYNISVSAPTLEEAKKRFINALVGTDEPQAAAVPTAFDAFTRYYFDTFRSRSVTAKTMKNDLSRYNAHIAPHFGVAPLKSIMPPQVQMLIDKLANTPKTAHEVYSLLNVIFKMAIKHNLIKQNPCDIVFLPRYEKRHGKALSKDEEKKLLTDTANTPYQIMFAVALYTGLRPNEYKTATISGEFISARNSKQKDGKEHVKRIPIVPMLAPYLANISKVQFYHISRITDKFKEILPNHKLYDLRTTFYTRCQECGVSELARNLFVGHSLGGLAATYTDISDEYLLKEGAKIEY